MHLIFVFSSSLAAFMLLWHKTIIHCVARTTAACKHGLSTSDSSLQYNIYKKYVVCRC